MKLQVRTAHGGHTMHWRTRKTQPTLRGLSSHVPWGCYMSWSSDPGTIAHRRNTGLVSFLLPLLITSVLTDQYITLLCVFYLNINSWHWAYGQEHCNSCLNHAHPTRGNIFPGRPRLLHLQHWVHSWATLEGRSKQQNHQQGEQKGQKQGTK